MIANKRFIDTSEESISHYLKEVRKIDILTPEEEAIVAKKVKEGDERAIEKLITSNLRFVISVAKEYQGQGIPLVDLIAEGNYGLIKAADRFDPTRGFRFISYAVWWIKQSIIQSLNEQSRTVRLPVNITNQISKIKKEMTKFEQENERTATNNDFDISVLNQPSCKSLNEKINENGDEILDIIPDKSYGNDDGENSEEILKNEIENTMGILNERERSIIQMYFGLDGQPMTLEQIGDEYGLTKERIRQIKEKALRRLKNNCENLFEFIYK